MPYNDDENHSPSEFYYPEQTNDPFWPFFYKVTTNCNPTKPYNKSLINLVCLVYSVKNCLRFLSHRPRSLVARSLQYFPVQISHLVNKSLIFMFCPRSFFSNQIQIDQFEKKLVGQNMNI